MVPSTLYVEDAGAFIVGGLPAFPTRTSLYFWWSALLDSAHLPSLPLPFSFCLHVCSWRAQEYACQNRGIQTSDDLAHLYSVVQLTHC